MKALIFGDLQVHDYKKYNEDGERLYICLDVLQDLFGVADEEQADAILFVGDLFDQPKHLLTLVINTVTDAFSDMFKKYPHIQFFAISGNHDHADKNLIHAAATSTLTWLDRVFDNFIVIDNGAMEFKDGTRVYGIPYYKRIEDFIEVANSFDSSTSRSILLMHQTPEGIFNEHIPADIDPEHECFDTFDHIFCGHIHQYQKISKKFYIVGSPLARDAGERDEEKGYLMYDHGKVTRHVLEGYFEIPESEEIEIEENENMEDVERYISEDRQQLILNYWEDISADNPNRLEIGMSFL